MNVGDIVTCKYTVGAYYSGYAGQPIMLFEPGMRGQVAAITPKTYVQPVDKKHDSKDTFLVVDFYHPEYGVQRCGLNFCNAKRVDKAPLLPSGIGKESFLKSMRLVRAAQ